MSVKVRRPYAGQQTLVLIGPGGVGKSTLGRALATRLGWHLVDLDLVFCDRLAIIGDYIALHGYPAYRAANLRLAQQLVAAIERPTIFVTASGFLAAPPESDDFRAAAALVATGYAVTLLPSGDIDIATDIVVARQLTRGLSFNRADEIQKFRERFAIYRPLGDLLVTSHRPPAELAEAVAARLHPRR